MQLPGRHTFAIIPGSLYGKKLAAFAQQENKEIILHLPLQASSIKAPSEENTLNELMDENQLGAKTAAMLSEFKNIRGINNHMGSHLTQFDYFMRPILESVKTYQSKLFFLDSRTSPKSVAYAEAIKSGLNAISRDVFLDNEHENKESIHLQFQIWLQIARERGSSVAIGHPHTGTIEYLKNNITATEQLFQFMTVSTLIELTHQEKPLSPWDAKLSRLQNPENR